MATRRRARTARHGRPEAPPAAPETMPLPLPELQRRLADPDVPLAALKPYLVIVRDDATGAPKLAPNPETVSDLDDPGLRTRGMGGMDALNGAERVRRRVKFERRLLFDRDKPVLLAEGDSWFEYPVLLDDTIDALLPDYNVFCLSAAGDTMADMSTNIEVVDSLFRLVRERGVAVKAVLLSAGGNDIVGDTLARCVRKFSGQVEPGELIAERPLRDELDRVMQAYRLVIAKLRTVRADIPILVHGYDHAIPLNRPLPSHPWDTDPLGSQAPRDGWLAIPLASKGIVEPKLQAGIVRLIIDQFYERLAEFANADGTGAIPRVYLIDNRRTVKGRWNDELHPTKPGFAAVAANFATVLKTLP